MLVLPLFIKEEKAKSNLREADNNRKNTLVELRCCGTQGASISEMTMFSFAVTVFHFHLLNYITPCVLMSMSS